MALILDEAIAPQQPIPLRMTFLIAWGTLMTLLGGGSAGIEATGVQMACGLADAIGRKLRLTPQERPILLTTVIAAGFGSIFGTPVAGPSSPWRSYARALPAMALCCPRFCVPCSPIG